MRPRPLTLAAAGTSTTTSSSSSLSLSLDWVEERLLVVLDELFLLLAALVRLMTGVSAAFTILGAGLLAAFLVVTAAAFTLDWLLPRREVFSTAAPAAGVAGLAGLLLRLRLRLRLGDFAARVFLAADFEGERRPFLGVAGDAAISSKPLRGAFPFDRVERTGVLPLMIKIMWGWGLLLFNGN